jgi:tungstate transport system ATP-binding protein
MKTSIEHVYKIRNLVYAYQKGHNVLNIPKLNIEQGKIYAVFGASGAGKTTLLKILNGLIKSEKGRVLIYEEPIEKENYRKTRADTVYVHQNPVLLSGTVFYNVAYGLKVRKMKGESVSRIVHDTLGWVGMDGFEKRKGNSLSGGEIQRVAICRALAISPKVLLLDEPTANIDRDNIRRIEDIFLKLNRELNTTIIVSTHDLFFGRSVSDRILYLSGGELVDQD